MDDERLQWHWRRVDEAAKRCEQMPDFSYFVYVDIPRRLWLACLMLRVRWVTERFMAWLRRYGGD